jgi:hypothetical protein
VIDVKAYNGNQPSSESSARSRLEGNTAPAASSGTQTEQHQSSQSLSSIDEGIPGETVAVIRNDGSLQPSQYIGQFATCDESAGDDELCDNNSGAVHNQAGGEETDDGIFSQSEYFPLSTDDEDSDDTAIFRDTQVLDIDPSAEAFIDGGVILSNCVSETEEDLLRFCIRTMIIHDTEPAVLILKEPCGGLACQHIEVRARSGLAIDHQTPCYLQPPLRENEGLRFLGEDSSRHQDLRLHLRSRCQRTSKNLVTMVLRQSGAYKVYAVPTVLNAHFPADIEDGVGEEEEEGEEEAEGGDKGEGREEDEGSQGGADKTSDNEGEGQPDTSSDTTSVTSVERRDESERHTAMDAGGPFSKLPCFFCRTDALQPRLTARGGQALLFVQNNSFGYTCERCGERTWISATQYGLTGIGASWVWR